MQNPNVDLYDKKIQFAGMHVNPALSFTRAMTVHVFHAEHVAGTN